MHAFCAKWQRVCVQTNFFLIRLPRDKPRSCCKRIFVWCGSVSDNHTQTFSGCAVLAPLRRGSSSSFGGEIAHTPMTRDFERMCATVQSDLKERSRPSVDTFVNDPFPFSGFWLRCRRSIGRPLRKKRNTVVVWSSVVETTMFPLRSEQSIPLLFRPGNFAFLNRCEKR